MVERSRIAGLLRGAVATALLAATYPLIFRDHCLTWGATDDEVHRTMPGDDLLPEPGTVTTRAVTVCAAPADIWPWLVQMGPGRGGAYTYDWIENLLGLDMHSADEIKPELQHLAVGDTLTMGTGPAMRVAILEPEQALVFRSEDAQWVWAFGLYPAADGTTRLVSRNRIAPRPSPLARGFFALVMEPGSLIMERKMLLGIKHRAERPATETAPV
ncbi:SRPBCC family protein [Nocardia wallacei]|uniref:SRPBCC family protein n=1 Tax=Nocardia wallacei TaxID=480035 RepID=UPI0024578735|nr:SRPBCC family protein [Nocardia wallacei]